MPILTLAETLAIAAPERGRLVEADDAIRDVVLAVEEAARGDGLDERVLSRALVNVMIAAAAQKVLAVYPSIPQGELAAAFRALAAESFEWASQRGGALMRGARG